MDVAKTMSKKVDSEGKIKSVASYSDLAKRVQGFWGVLLVNIMMFLTQFSCCVNYLYFISEQINMIVKDKTGVDHGIHFYIYILILPSIPISMIKTYTYLSYVSMAGVAGSFLAGLMMIGYCGNKLENDTYVHSEIKVFDIS